MPIMYNTGDWFTLRPGITYRKFELYNMDLPIDAQLEEMSLTAATHGGPIALIRDSKQIIRVNVAKPTIRIFTSSGQFMSSIIWKSGKLITMGWSDAEELLCVQDDGLVLIYDIFGNYQHTFSMGQEAKDTKVIDARIFPSSSGTGVAVMTTNFRVFLINSIKEPRNRQLPEMPKSNLVPNCWQIITEDRNTYAVIVRDKQVFKLKQGDSVCTLLAISFERDFSSIISMGVSYNHKYIAFYTNNGLIWMGTSDLKTKYCEFNTGRSEKPKQIEWILDCENNRTATAIVITYPSLLMILSTSGDMNIYTYDLAISLVAEMDGVRVITNNCHEMIQSVPKCVSNIFAINSQEPSSWLFEAHKKYLERSHQSDEYLCLIKDNLELAVAECVEAAGYEFDTETQKSLIRAAYFGKSFIPAHKPDDYISMCRILRVLNAVRYEKIGIPITYKQFNHLKPIVLLDRLIFRKQYGLAIHIANHLGLPESRILEHWAYQKVITDKNDEEVARKITEKFQKPNVKGVSFCKIAEKAQEVGRTKLAIMLLEKEPKPSLQVPLLLKLGENKRALHSATQSGDTDLVYMVILQLKETVSFGEFQLTIRQFPMAQNLYKKYLEMTNNKSALLEIYNQEDDFQAQALFYLKEGIDNKTLESSLPMAAAAYKKAHKDLEAELCDETRKLLKQQKIFAEKYSSDFNGLSTHDTCKRLLEIGDIKQADKLRSEYKIPDRRYWWLRIQVLADLHQWDELDKLSKSKKSPIGYEPFVEVCLMNNNKKEARKYLPKCREDEKIKWYIRTGLADEAATTAFERKDLDSLHTIRIDATKTNDRDLVAKVDNYIAQLSTRK